VDLIIVVDDIMERETRELLTHALDPSRERATVNNAKMLLIRAILLITADYELEDDIMLKIIEILRN